MTAPKQIEFFIWQGHPDERWNVEVRGRDLMDDYATAGAALDAADKWATDRGYRLMVNGLTVSATKAPAQIDGSGGER